MIDEDTANSNEEPDLTFEEIMEILQEELDIICMDEDLPTLNFYD
jgi:hypothetical protein